MVDGGTRSQGEKQAPTVASWWNLDLVTGSYPVYVRYSDEGSWGKRIAEVKVVFIDDGEDNDEACYLCGASIDDGYCGDCSDDD